MKALFLCTCMGLCSYGNPLSQLLKIFLIHVWLHCPSNCETVHLLVQQQCHVPHHTVKLPDIKHKTWNVVVLGSVWGDCSVLERCASPPHLMWSTANRFCSDNTGVSWHSFPPLLSVVCLVIIILEKKSAKWLVIERENLMLSTSSTKQLYTHTLLSLVLPSNAMGHLIITKVQTLCIVILRI